MNSKFAKERKGHRDNLVFTESNDTQEECKIDIEQANDLSLITSHRVL